MKDIAYHTNYRLEDNYWWFLARRQIVRDLIERNIPISESEYVIDIGCGTCGMAKFLSEKFNVIALDKSELAAEYCKKRGIKDVYLTELADFPNDKYKIKVATILDVIEHIEDDKNIASQLFDFLPDGSWLVASVPAYQFLWSYHDEVHKHYRRYTKAKIVNLLKSSGFTIKYSSYFNTLLFPIALLKRFIDIITQVDKKNEYAIEVVPNFVNKLFTKIFASESKLMKFMRFPFGLSIIIIAKKDINLKTN